MHIHSDGYIIFLPVICYLVLGNDFDLKFTKINFRIAHSSGERTSTTWMEEPQELVGQEEYFNRSNCWTITFVVIEARWMRILFLPNRLHQARSIQNIPTFIVCTVYDVLWQKGERLWKKLGSMTVNRASKLWLSLDKLCHGRKYWSSLSLLQFMSFVFLLILLSVLMASVMNKCMVMIVGRDSCSFVPSFFCISIEDDESLSQTLGLNEWFKRGKERRRGRRSLLLTLKSLASFLIPHFFLWYLSSLREIDQDTRIEVTSSDVNSVTECQWKEKQWEMRKDGRKEKEEERFQDDEKNVREVALLREKWQWNGVKRRRRRKLKGES